MDPVEGTQVSKLILLAIAIVFTVIPLQSADAAQFRFRHGTSTDEAFLPPSAPKPNHTALVLYAPAENLLFNGAEHIRATITPSVVTSRLLLGPENQPGTSVYYSISWWKLCCGISSGVEYVTTMRVQLGVNIKNCILILCGWFPVGPADDNLTEPTVGKVGP